MYKAFNLVLYLFCIVVRFISVYFVITVPLFGWVLMFVVDTIDYNFALKGGLTFKQYQYIDKSLDLVNMFYLVIGAYFNNFEYFWLYPLLFMVRVVGEVFYLKTRSDKYLFIFPNVIEFVFPLQILLPQYPIVVPVGLSLLFKLSHEYLLHVFHWVDPISTAYIKKHPEHKRKLK